jgi:hypothetical protein
MNRRIIAVRPLLTRADSLAGWAEKAKIKPNHNTTAVHARIILFAILINALYIFVAGNINAIAS